MDVSKFWRSLATLSVASIFALAAGAAEAGTTYLKWNKSTSRNVAFIVAEHWDVHPDCSLRGYPTAKVVSAPKHGTTKIGRGKFKLGRKFAKDPYYKCKSLTVSGTTIRYTPKPGFTGKDVLKVRATYSTGDVHVIDIVVTVR